jgi:hypothetical protein
VQYNSVMVTLVSEMHVHWEALHPTTTKDYRSASTVYT